MCIKMAFQFFQFSAKMTARDRTSELSGVAFMLAEFVRAEQSMTVLTALNPALVLVLCCGREPHRLATLFTRDHAIWTLGVMTRQLGPWHFARTSRAAHCRHGLIDSAVGRRAFVLSERSREDENVADRAANGSGRTLSPNMVFEFR